MPAIILAAEYEILIDQAAYIAAAEADSPNSVDFEDVKERYAEHLRHAIELAEPTSRKQVLELILGFIAPRCEVM